MEPIKLDSKPLQTFSADEQLSKKLHSIMPLFLNWLVDRPKGLDLDDVKQEAEERIIAPKPNSKEVFEETITEILRRGLGSMIPFRPSNSKLPVGETWGCLRIHGKQEPRRVFAISTRQLDLLAQNCCPDSCDWQMILLDMRRKPPAYLLPVKNCRVFGVSKAENSVLIDIDKARFLPQEMRTTIKKMFQGMS